MTLIQQRLRGWKFGAAALLLLWADMAAAGGGTPVQGLVLCGAGVFPGIGVPPVAVSGAMAAHHFVDARRQRRLLQETGILAA